MTAIELTRRSDLLPAYVVETEELLSPDNMRDLLKAVEGLFQVVVVPPEVRSTVKKYQIQSIALNGNQYEYMLSNKAHNRLYGEPSTFKAIKYRLERDGFDLSEKEIVKKDGKILAKYNMIGRRLVLSPMVESIDERIIWAFPGTFTVYRDDYHIWNRDLKELAFMGHMDIEYKYWEKNG